MALNEDQQNVLQAQTISGQAVVTLNEGDGVVDANGELICILL